MKEKNRLKHTILPLTEKQRPAEECLVRIKRGFWRINIRKSRERSSQTAFRETALAFK